MFNPAEYHFDPEIYKAHLATQEATKRATPSFATGFTGGQDLSTLKGFGAWGTGGLSGQLITKALAGDKEVEFFIQRHGVDFGLSELNKQIEALNKEASLRPLSSKEQAYLKEAELKREEVVSGLQFAKEHLGGDLDAPMYEDGTSFNESWGISSNEEIGLSQFFETLRKHPEHTAGAIVGELVKDFPLTAASIFGLSKVNNIQRAVKLVRRRLAGIQPKSLRFATQLGTGVGVGAGVGAGYEAAFSWMDEGSIKTDDVWMGAEFGGLFGILGGLALMRGEKAPSAVLDLADEALSGTEASLGKATKATEAVAKKGQEALDVAEKLNADQDLITEAAENLTILPNVHQQVRTLADSERGIVRTEIDSNTGDVVTYLNRNKLEEQRKALLKEVEDRIKRGEEIDSLSFRNLNTLKNPKAYEALTLAQSKARGKYLLDRSKGKILPEDWEADVVSLTQREIDLYDRNFKAKQLKKRKQIEEQQEREELETEEGLEATAIGQKIDERKAMIEEHKRLSEMKDKDLTEENRERLVELEERLKELEEKEEIELAPPGKLGLWMDKHPKKAIAAGALAGATLIPGEDNIYGALAGAGVALAGPKAYKAITRANFNQAAWKARAAIQKGIEVNANDMKVLEMEMQYVVTEIHKVFPEHSDGLRLISYLETGKNKGEDGAALLTTKEELDLAKRTRDILDLIGKEAADAGVIRHKDDIVKGKFKKGEKGAFLHNYFPHMFNTKMTDEDLAELVEIWGKDTSKQSLERVMLGSIEMIKKKFPKKAKNLIDNPTRALELYTQAMTRAIHGKRMLSSLAELDLSMGKGTFLPSMMSEGAYKILKKQGKITEQEALHYETLDHSSLEGYRVHTDMKPLVDDHFDVLRKGTIPEVMQSILDLNNGLKRIFVFGSLFHGQALLTSLAYSLGMKGFYHGVKGSPHKMLEDGTMWSHLQLGSEEFRGLAEHAIRSGLQIINIKKQELVTPGREKVNNILDKWGKTGQIPRKAFDGIDYLTWEYFHDRFKLATFLIKEEKKIKSLKKKGYGDKEAREIAARQAADFANDAYGSLNWDNFTTKLYEYAAKNPTKLRGRIAGIGAEMLPVKKRKWANLFLFAPDWTISNLRIVGRTLSLGYKYTDGFLKAFHRGDTAAWKSKQGVELLEAWKTYAAYSARAGVINSMLWWGMMEMFSDKEPTMDRLADFWYGPASHKLDLGGGHSVVISKQIAEPIHWVQHPMHTLSNKMSVMPKSAMELFMNKQWFSLKKEIPTGPALIDADGNYHHAKWLLGKVTPIVIKPIFQEDLSFMERMNRVLTGFGGFPQYSVKQD